ncbi:ankyrin repeat-containing protein [Campylobacter geochelonis]|nr:ankyrin repeat-containing protein [Campylobacter geochelonis]
MIEKIIIDNDNINILYDANASRKSKISDGKSPHNTFFYIVMNGFTEIAELALKSGYIPNCTQNNIYDELCYKELTNIPNYEPMLELMLKYNVPGQPTKEQLKEAYEKCYEDRAWFLERDYDTYVHNVEKINRIMKNNGEKPEGPISRIEYEAGLTRTLNRYNKHCSDENGTFKDTKAYINYANDYSKNYAVDSFINRNKNNPSKVIYLDKHSSKSNSNLTDENKNKN